MTVISGGVTGDTPEQKEKRSCQHQKKLRLVREVLENESLMEKMLSKYEIDEEAKEEYEINHKRRILQVLHQAEVAAEEYEAAIKESSKRGITVVLERDITETMVNNYNGEWIRAWNANIDIQVCLDFFSVITYITEYFTKVSEDNILNDFS